MKNFNWDKEFSEALVAADKTLIHLNSALKEIESAKNWGILDIAGGGVFTSIIKRGRIKDVETELKLAKEKADILISELEDLDRTLDISLEIDEFLEFTDIFLDNIFSDFAVQSKIQKTKKNIQHAIIEIENIKELLFEAKKLKKKL